MLTKHTGQYTSSSSGYELIGHWQRPISTDRTCLVAFFSYWMLTVLDRMLDPQGPVNIDRTRPVADSLLWNLTGVDQTLPLSVWSLDLLASGQTRHNHLGQMN